MGERDLYNYTLYISAWVVRVLCNRKFTQEWNADFVWYWPRTLHYAIAACAAASLQSALAWQGMPGADGETLVSKVQSIGGAAYAKAEVIN